MSLYHLWNSNLIGSNFSFYHSCNEVYNHPRHHLPPSCSPCLWPSIVIDCSWPSHSKSQCRERPNGRWYSIKKDGATCKEKQSGSMLRKWELKSFKEISQFLKRLFRGRENQLSSSSKGQCGKILRQSIASELMKSEINDCECGQKDLHGPMTSGKKFNPRMPVWVRNYSNAQKNQEKKTPTAKVRPHLPNGQLAHAECHCRLVLGWRSLAANF